MTNHKYWEPTEFPVTDSMKAWVSENVIAALSDLIEQGNLWIQTKDGRLSVTFASFEMPDAPGRPGDVWHKDFDLLEMVMGWADDYNDLPSISDEQRKDLEERSRLLDELALKFKLRARLQSS